MKKTKLDEDIIEKICELVKLRLSWVKIAASISVTDTTLRNWRSKGKKAKSGIYRRLVDAIRVAEADIYEEYSTVVRDAAIFGYKQTTKKIVIAADGSRRTEIVEKTMPPNADMALKLLALIDPPSWATVQQIKVDWQKPIKEAGITPETAEQAFFNFLEDHKDEIGTIEIPEIPERTV